MTEHTPIDIKDIGIAGGIIIQNADNEPFCEAENNDIAGFIVRACNNQEALVEALEDAINCIMSFSSTEAFTDADLALVKEKQQTLAQAKE